jgi:hypothetical protein
MCDCHFYFHRMEESCLFLKSGKSGRLLSSLMVALCMPDLSLSTIHCTATSYEQMRNVVSPIEISVVRILIPDGGPKGMRIADCELRNSDLRIAEVEFWARKFSLKPELASGSAHSQNFAIRNPQFEFRNSKHHEYQSFTVRYFGRVIGQLQYVRYNRLKHDFASDWRERLSDSGIHSRPSNTRCSSGGNWLAISTSLPSCF